MAAVAILVAPFRHHLPQIVHEADLAFERRVVSMRCCERLQSDRPHWRSIMPCRPTRAAGLLQLVGMWSPDRDGGFDLILERSPRIGFGASEPSFIPWVRRESVLREWRHPHQSLVRDEGEPS